MAAIVNPAQVRLLHVDGQAAQCCLYAVRNVNAGDTLDLGPSGPVPNFLSVKFAAMIGSTTPGAATATVSGTVVTMPATLSNDAIYLLAWGDASI